ncbi:hypothetical protein COV15_00730 [Candidatus Woesearchaeota archaeon CG10_big_fil_rev_8_21_14_0_10_34_12]|nr:MAG: hypothetical protein COV15_00730 [Candidatus Woesearchaeota archaeon CG10_big_fil_rev_8_21_14_0_10_34_12]
MKNIYVLLALVLVVVLLGGYLVYIVYQQKILLNIMVGKNETIGVINSNVTTEMFYRNMRFNSSKISFHISNDCSDYRRERMIDAMSMLENHTLLTFKESSDENMQVHIFCSREAKNVTAKEYIVGEGGPTKIIDTGLFNLILEGELSLFQTSIDCISPNVEMHELLHVLGFAHVNNTESIMYPISSCNQKITQDIIDSINSLYSYLPEPDLYLANLNLTKKVGYIDFQIEIGNQGLISSPNVMLIVENNEKQEEFEIPALEVGEGRILDVKNLKISGNLVFYVDYNDLNKDNNVLRV